MIKYYLDIQNFQGIRKAKLEIQGLTVLVGHESMSNIGKTSVVRALRGVLFGKSFKGMVRRGERFTRVIFGWDEPGDKHLLCWQKGEGVNSLQLDNHFFDKLGKSYPEEVAGLGFRPVSVGTLELLLQVKGQFHKTFPLELSATDLGSVISRMIKTDKVNEAMRELLSDKMRLATMGTDLNSKLVELRKKSEGFKDLSGLVDELDSFSVKMHGLRERSEKLLKIKGLLGEILDVRGQVKKTGSKLEVKSGIEVEEKVDKYQKVLILSNVVVDLKRKVDCCEVVKIPEFELKDPQDLRRLKDQVLVKERIMNEMGNLSKKEKEQKCLLESVEAEMKDLGLEDCPECQGTGVVKSDKSHVCI